MAHVILGLLLLAGPQTVYALSKQFEHGPSLFYRGGLGSLRSALLGLLARDEVEFEVSVERGRAKKTYRPTGAGRIAFFAWLRAPITGAEVETAALSKLFFLGLLEGAPERRAVLADIVERIERDVAGLAGLDEALAAIEVPRESRLVFDYQRAALDYGLGAHRFALAHFTALRDAE